MTPPATPAHAGALRRSVLMLSLACFCSMATQRICDAMLPELSREFGASMARTAQVVSVFAVVYGLAQLFYGSLGDRYGKLRVLTWTTLASGLACLAAAFSNSLDFLVAARAGSALFSAAIIPMALAWTGDAVSYEKRQETLARVGLGTTMGIVGGQLLGGLFTDTLGWRWAFVFMTVLFLLVGGFLLADLRREANPAPSDTPAQGMWRQTADILRQSWPRRLLVVSVVQGGAGFGIVATIASHLHEVHGLSLSMAGATVALFGLGGVLYMAVAKHLIHRLGEHGMARVGGGGMALAMGVVGLSPWWQLAPAAMLLGGFAFFMLHNTLQANATQMVPQARGLGVSMFATGLFLGQALGVVVATILIPRLGSGPVIAGGALMMGVGAFWLSVQLRERQRLRAANA
jgi:predicted MFS family arabinose efflux permease